MKVTIYYIEDLYVIKYEFKPGHVTYERCFNNVFDADAFITLLYHNFFILNSSK